MKKPLYLACALLVLLPSIARAQAAGFSWIADSNGGVDMPLLYGWAGAARIGSGPVVFRVERQTGRASRNRVVCAGLIPPPDPRDPVNHCPDESARLSVESVAGSVGFHFDLGGGERVRYMAEPAIGVVRVQGGYTGLETGNVLTDRAHMLRGTVGLGASAQPRRSVPVRVVLGARVSTALGGAADCVDCFTTSWGKGYVGAGVSAGLVLVLR